MKITQTADKIEQRPVASLVPSPNNARVHSHAQIAKISKALNEFGWTFPLLVTEDGEVIAGHGRLEAAKRLQMETVPVIVAKGWSDEKRRAYMIADNKLAEESSWDIEALGREIMMLTDDGYDVDVLGFSDEEIASFLPQAEDQSILGDIGGGEEAPKGKAKDPHETPKGVQLNLNYEPEERDIIIKFLAAERDSRGLKTGAEALLAIAVEGLE